MRVVVLCLLLAATLSLPVLAQKYDAAIFTHNGPIALYDSVAGKVTSLIPQARLQPSRGAMFGLNGRIYQGEWTTNGIDVWDPQVGWVAGLQVADSTNYIMGAPYQPCPNYDNLGGFGIFCVDGNPSAVGLTDKSTFLVDYSALTPTFRADGKFPATTEIPMSDMYPNLFATQPGEEFIGIGFPTDQKVDIYPLAGAGPYPAAITPINLVTMPLPAQYDATWAEDGNLYVISNNALMAVDIRTRTVTTLQLTGLPTGYAAIWCAPWEQPGMKAWICSDTDDTIYTVDLMALPPIPVTKTVKIGPSAYDVNTGRHAEENQLLSWIDISKKGRVFHAEFNPNYGGNANVYAVLVPSMTGLSNRMILLGSLEIYLQLDQASFLALSGLLYPNFKNLKTNGQVDFAFNYLGLPLGVRTYWQCVLFDSKSNQFLDATNIINVEIH